MGGHIASHPCVTGTIRLPSLLPLWQAVVLRRLDHPLVCCKHHTHSQYAYPPLRVLGIRRLLESGNLFRYHRKSYSRLTMGAFDGLRVGQVDHGCEWGVIVKGVGSWLGD